MPLLSKLNLTFRAEASAFVIEHKSAVREQKAPLGALPQRLTPFHGGIWWRGHRQGRLELYTDEVLQALPITYCALVLIHPFREGNGRVSRLLSTLMALHAGMRRNYAPMEEIFWRVVAASN